MIENAPAHLSPPGSPTAAGVSGKLVPVLVILAAVGLAGLGWWLYLVMTKISSPDPSTATSTEITAFLGNPQAFARLSRVEREAFLLELSKQFSGEERSRELARSVRRMSEQEKKTFVDAAFDLARTRFMERAEQFRRLPVDKRDEFVADSIAYFKSLQGNLGGNGKTANDMSQVLKHLLPSTPAGISQFLTDKTTIEERTKAQPFVDAIIQKVNELKQ